MGNLGGEVVALDGHEVRGGGNVLSDEGFGGDVDEIGAEDFGDEGEGAGGAEVAFDDFEEGFAALGVVGFDDLHVEGAGDVPGLGDALGDVLAAGHDGGFEVCGREDQSGITGVHAGLLDVFGHGVDDEVAVGGDAVDVDFLRAFDEFGDDDWVVGGDVGSGFELILEVFLAADDGHGCAGEDVAGADEDGVADFVGEVFGGGDRRELLPRGLVNADAVEDFGELLAIFGLVDVLGVGAENVGAAGLLEAEGDVLGQLATDGDDDSRGVFELVDIHDTLVTELFKVQLVGFVVIGGHGLRVVLVLLVVASGEGVVGHLR